MNYIDSTDRASNYRKKTFEKLSQQLAHIKGWAVDANPRNDPTYPIRSRFDEDNQGYSWERPPQQAESQEILQSNERPNLPSVFGTSSPATGLSGMLRRYAFRFSEGRFRHWLLLLLADRVNVVEGLAEDTLSGKVPHCLDERGFNVEWRHNRTQVIECAVMGAVAIGVLALLLKTSKKS